MKISKEFASAVVLGSLLLSSSAPQNDEQASIELAGSRLCARVDLEAEVAKAETMHMSYVRLWEPFADIATPDSRIESLIQVAEQKGIVPIVVLTPTSLPDREILREKIHFLLTRHQALVLEIGNEPDNVVYEFWKDRDPATFAVLVEMSITEIDRIDPERPVIVAAMSNVDKNNKKYDPHPFIFHRREKKSRG